MATYWTREEEYEQERAAIAREAYETFCEEQSFDPEAEEAEDAYRAYVLAEQEREEREAYDERMIEEYQMRQQDEQDYRDANWE